MVDQFLFTKGGMMSKIYDVAIIGSGPAALSAAIYTARDGLATIVLEKGAVGGLMATIDKIDNYPGLPGVTGMELSEQMQAQAEGFGVEVEMVEVTKCSQSDNVVRITTDNREIIAKTVIIATGGAYKKLGIIGEEKAHYCATCDGPLFRDKRLVVIGGANAAVQEAMFLSRFAVHIDLVARRDFTASQVLMDALAKNDKITTHVNLRADEIVTERGMVTAVKFGDKTFECDGVFIFAGQTPATEFLPASGIDLDENGYVLADERLMTNIGGVFVAGDVRSGTIRQIATAVGDGAVVAHSVREYISKEVK
jgi:thioredoxin reductase (NADPH)